LSVLNISSEGNSGAATAAVTAVATESIAATATDAESTRVVRVSII
jgi:hypothetical protein